MFIAWGLVGVVALLLGVAATRPDRFRYARSIVVSKPSEVPFAHVVDLHKWEAWSPWANRDPAMSKSYTGAETGVGSKYAWSSKNNSVGEGSMTISGVDAPRSVDVDLSFTRPFQANNQVKFTFEPESGGTKVTWAMEGRNAYMAKVFGLFMDMEKMLNADFDKGLAALKRVSETEGA
jgi:hypothetical protein